LASQERELAPGGARALHWPDAGRPLRLCVRVQEAGWLWSGGVALDTPGDLFVKIRHRRAAALIDEHADCCIVLEDMAPLSIPCEAGSACVCVCTTKDVPQLRHPWQRAVEAASLPATHTSPLSKQSRASPHTSFDNRRGRGCD